MNFDLEKISVSIQELPEYFGSDGQPAEIGFPVPRKVNGKFYVAFFAHYEGHTYPDRVFLYDPQGDNVLALLVEDALERFGIRHFPAQKRDVEPDTDEENLEELFLAAADAGAGSDEAYRRYIASLAYAAPSEQKGFYWAMIEPDPKNYQFKEMPAAVVHALMPEIADKQVIAFAIQDEFDEPHGEAIFVPAVLNQKEAVMYQFHGDADFAEHDGDVHRFFEICFQRLKEAGFHSVYFRSTGDYGELSVKYDMLTEVGFEPFVLLGDMHSYRLGDLLDMKFVKKYKDNGKKGLPIHSLSMDPSGEEKLFMNRLAKDNRIFLHAVYTPQYSLICYRQETQTGGLLCMSRVEDLLVMTVFDLEETNKPARKKLLAGMLGELLLAAADLPADTEVRMFYDNRFDKLEAERIFGSSGNITHLQEFLYEL
jgi:hypothetical protein